MCSCNGFTIVYSTACASRFRFSGVVFVVEWCSSVLVWAQLYALKWSEPQHNSARRAASRTDSKRSYTLLSMMGCQTDIYYSRPVQRPFKKKTSGVVVATRRRNVTTKAAEEQPETGQAQQPLLGTIYSDPRCSDPFARRAPTQATRGWRGRTSHGFFARGPLTQEGPLVWQLLCALCVVCCALCVLWWCVVLWCVWCVCVVSIVLRLCGPLPDFLLTEVFSPQLIFKPRWVGVGLKILPHS